MNRVDISLAASPYSPDNRISVNGTDVTRVVRSVTISSAVDQVTAVSLDLIPREAVVRYQGLADLRAFAHCESCRWWKAHAPNVGILGYCELFECRDKEQVHRHSKVIVSRTGTGEATIVTASDFGCAQWEGRERATGTDAGV